MATYLLFHGAWHGGWCWDEVAAYLRGGGHRVLAPDLPGLSMWCEATTAAKVGLQDHIDAVVTALDRLSGEPVILVAHSYAGMLARALEHLRPTRLAHVVYMEAVVPVPGKSLLDMQPAGAAETLRALSRETPTGIVLDPPDIVQRFAITDAKLAASIQARLRPHPLRTLTDPLPSSYVVHRQSYRRTYMFAQDRLPNPYQQFIDACARDETWQLIGINGGHEMMLTNGAHVAEVLARLATYRDVPAEAHSHLN